MNRNKKETRYERKWDTTFWYLVMLFPVISYFIQYFRGNATQTMLEYIQEKFVGFTNINIPIENAIEAAFGNVPALTYYIEYILMVLCIHVLFDVLAFIPRFAHKLIAYFCD